MATEEKQQALLALQATDTQLNEIVKLRGALPEEVAGLQAELGTLQDDLQSLQNTLQYLEEDIVAKKEQIKSAQKLVGKYKDQQMEVRNNREYDAITKEIELQELEIQLLERSIKQQYGDIDAKKLEKEQTETIIEKKRQALSHKEEMLKAVMDGNQKQEKSLNRKREKIIQTIDSDLVQDYERIRNNVRNKRAVVVIERGACSGCFNAIPPQRQLDIQEQKYMIHCEYCGRIMAYAPEEAVKASA